MSELEELKQRVVALEDFVQDLGAAMKKYAKTVAAPAQTQLLQDARTPVATPSSTRELSDELVAAFERVTGKKYVFDGAKDGQAVQRLVRLRFEDRAELLARWEQAVKMTNHPGTKSIAVFATRVNEYGSAAAKKQPISAPPAGDPYGEGR